MSTVFPEKFAIILFSFRFAATPGFFCDPVPCPACRWPERNRQTAQKAALRGDFPQGGNCSA
jgi:hypothetical protein